MKTGDPILSDTFAANYRDYRNIMSFAFHAKKRSWLDIKRTENRGSAEAKVFRYRHFALGHVAVLVKRFDKHGLRECEPRMPAKIHWQIRFVGYRRHLA